MTTIETECKRRAKSKSDACVMLSAFSSFPSSSSLLVVIFLRDCAPKRYSLFLLTNTHSAQHLQTLLVYLHANPKSTSPPSFPPALLFNSAPPYERVRHKERQINPSLPPSSSSCLTPRHTIGHRATRLGQLPQLLPSEMPPNRRAGQIQTFSKLTI